jgi:two-component system chemotaxis response regulator CheB
MIRVLVIDTSPEIRRILTEYLSADPSITVVGVAPNLSSARRQMEKLQPDIITIHEDLHDESALNAIMQATDPPASVPLVILGDIDEATRNILAPTIPHKRHTPAAKRPRAIVCKTPRDRRFTELCKRIHQLAKEQSETSDALQHVPRHSLLLDFGIIGIAVSTGGPNALLRILSDLSPELSVPVVVTQHMPGNFTPLLVERLQSRSPLAVFEAYDQQPLAPGSVYIAPGDRHLTVSAHESGAIINLSDAPKENSCRPSADVMFRSIADLYGKKALGLVLTGMGVDGQRGCKYLKDQGGLVMAQDQGSSTVWGMPKAVIHAGLADEVVSLNDIAALLNKRFTSRERK